MTAPPDRMNLIFQIIALHVWRHPKHRPDCEVCRCIKTGQWPAMTLP